MGSRRLTIVATCTDRKFAVPAPSLMARNLAAGPVRERADDWVRRLDRAQATARLMDLYKGESWTQTKRLATTAMNLGFEPQVFVASAGLGLRHVDAFAPSYAATFARGHADSVTSRPADAREWWSRLPHTKPDPCGDPAIWVLSESYAVAMQDDLDTLDSDTTLVFGGAAGTPEALRVPSNRNLRAALGGTISSLNTRMAIRWMEIAGGTGITSQRMRREWAMWSQREQQVEHHARKQLPDSILRKLLEEMRASQPGIAKTVALRRLRDSGIACEQRRFSGLFDEGSNA